MTRSTVSLRSFLKSALLTGGKFVRCQRRLDRGVLQAAELLVEIGDVVEGFEDLRLQRSFHRRKRQIAFVVEIVGFRLFGIGLSLGLGGIERLAIG